MFFCPKLACRAFPTITRSENIVQAAFLKTNLRKITWLCLLLSNMDSNARTNQYRSRTGSNDRGRGKQEKNDGDAFMRLVGFLADLTFPIANSFQQSDAEIAGCIRDIGVQFTPDDLVKPNPHQIQRVFEWFAELLMNATRETIEPAMSAAARDVCGEYAEIFQSDARNLMGFYITLRKLLVKVRTGPEELF